jgi:ribosome biogenesis GTPase A
LHVNKYILPNIQAKNPSQTSNPNILPNIQALAIMSTFTNFLKELELKHNLNNLKSEFDYYTQHGILKKVNNMKFKVMIISNEKSGKTSYINRMVNQPFCENYTQTLGIEVNPLVFRTNIGQITH